MTAFQEIVGKLNLDDKKGKDKKKEGGKKGKGKKGKKNAKTASENPQGDSASTTDEDDVPEALMSKLKSIAPKPPAQGPKNSMYREYQRTCLELFAPVVCDFLYDDFGGGFRKARMPDDLFAWILCVWLAKLPVRVFKDAKWKWRRLQGVPYDQGEILVLTKAALGISWDLISSDEIKEACEAELWTGQDKLDEWQYKQDVKHFGPKRANMLRKVRENGGDMDSDDDSDY